MANCLLCHCQQIVIVLIQMLLTVVCLSLSVARDGAVNAKEPVRNITAPSFETDVLPIFKAKCVACHHSKSGKAGLDLTSLTGVLKGSESGKITVKGRPDNSLLYEMIREGQMPPEGKTSLTTSEVETIRRWIQTGTHTQAKTAGTPADRVTQHNILPILYQCCTACHGLRRKEGGLDLRNKAAMLKGGKSGPAMVPGKPEQSLMLKRIRTFEMPPPSLVVDSGVKLIEASEIALVEKWIKQGALEVEIKPDAATTLPDSLVTDEDRRFWSFQPPKRPAVPTVKSRHRVGNPIDAFVLQKLAANGYSLSPRADRLTLIRRVAFDLTGLPPTWDEVERFVADKSPNAYGAMLDRYLCSPHYGERWGRYWLDVCGYADSEGKKSDDATRRHAWRYRDYVIRAFNADKPYDRFLTEQIAGDELVDYENAPRITPEIMDNLVATGFLRMAPDGTGYDVVNAVTQRLEVIVDEIDIFGSSVLGLTITCARCHSHKYDPIPQRDYYRLVAIFKGAYDEHDWLKPSLLAGKYKNTGRSLPYVISDERQRWKLQKQPIDSQIDKLKVDLESTRRRLVEKHLSARLEKLPQKLHDDLRKMLSTPADKRSEVQKYLASKFEKQLRIDTGTLERLEPEYDNLLSATEQRIKELHAQIPQEPRIRALWDRGVPSPTYIYRRGEFTNPGRLVGPGVPSVLTDGMTPFVAKPPWPGAQKTGRRLALAEWLLQPTHPLTARVMVNRIWKHHFGRGIVTSLENFGYTGARPTHPELLDWLATEFITGKWSIKHMHRLMLTSNTYRQVSTITPELERFDPDNQWLARMPLRRMEAEVLRDSILLVAGKLDRRRFGPPAPVDVQTNGLVTSVGTDRGWRRSIYVQQRRTQIPTILENFDLPQMIPNCIERPDSSVVAQTLHLMNNTMLQKQPRHLAERVHTEVGANPYQQVERIYRVSLSRPPSEIERKLGQNTIAELTKQWENHLGGEATDGEGARRALAKYCHTIINSAAFLYID